MKKTMTLLFALAYCTVFGQKLTQSINNGSWNTIAIWSNGVPGYMDTAIINNNVDNPSNNSAAKIIINAAGTLTNQATLNISYSLTNNGMFTDVAGTVNLTGGASAISVGGFKSTSFYNLFINNSNGVNATDTIIVKNGLALARGTLNVSAGYLVLQNDARYNGRVVYAGLTGSISGKYRAEIWDNRCSGAPIASDYSTYCPPVATNLSNMGLLLFHNAYTYNETMAGDKSIGYVAIPTNTTTINRGQGFFYDYSNYNGGPNFARKIPFTDTMSLSGKFAFPVTYTSSAGGIANDGWNLIGNPYPGTIDWQSSYWTKNKIDNGIYTWNTCSNLYAIFIAGVGINGGSRYINEFQGFWVHANRPGPQLMASKYVITGNASSLLRTSNDSVPKAVHIILGHDEIAIRLDSNATDGFDSLYDARSFFTDSSRIYSFINGDTADMYAVNAVKDSTYKVVPFAVRRSGVLSFTGLSSLKNYTVYLKDLYMTTMSHLDDGFQYTYVQDPAKDTIFDTKRFHLIFKDTVVTTSSVVNMDNSAQTTNFYPNPSAGDLILNCAEPGSVLTIYDVLGQELLTQKIEHNKTLLHLNFPAGMYFIRVQSDTGLLLCNKLEIVKS